MERKLKHILFKERHGNIKIMGIFKFYSFSTKYNHENKYNRCSHSYLSFSTTMAKYIIGVVLFYERCTLSRVVR
ncbi:putative protein 164R [Cricket iridovirus]|uniref:Uncharacterized protein n=1 Tax=Iridovirus sp. TaxID=135728 RepID=A0AAU7YDN2_9VIRU|nr:putative protein 164R [Cricket iridovirus]